MNMAELTFARTCYTQLGDWEQKEEQRSVIATPTQVLNLKECCGEKTYYTQFGGCDSEQRRRLINVTDTGIYNLGEACERFFANTGVQPADLLYQSKKKKLKLTRIGKNTLVSAKAIHEMIIACQGKENLPDCSRKNEQVARRSGSLSMPDAKSAQAAAEKTFAELTKHSKTT
jgi:hypothetical protein